MSNLIKSSYYVPLEDIKKIEAVRTAPVHPEQEDVPAGSGTTLPQQDEMLEESIRLKDQLLADARNEAEDLIRKAREEADKLFEAAKLEAEGWWEERRGQDDELREQARQEGYEAGFAQGSDEAAARVMEQYEAKIAEGRTVLEQAYEASRQTVSEAEPFLIELSCAVAEKIIGRQLELSPDWTVAMIRQALKRSIDRGTVALCVSPAQFAYVQSVRDELTGAIDAQAELQILPDASVRDHGCVIKTSFGTIDARVDTQLSEIKQALLDICKRGELASEE